MKVLLINGSPNINGNTNYGLNLIANVLKNNDIETKIYQLGDKKISPCQACQACYKMRNNRCIIDDDLNELIEECLDIDGLILSSPIHYAGISGLAKNAYDRLFYVSSANKNIFRHKVGASFVSVRRSGGIAGFNALNNYLLYSDMFLAGSNYWNIIHGRVPTEAQYDNEGVQTLENMANNFSYLLKATANDLIEKPQPLKKQVTNFIREDLINK